MERAEGHVLFIGGAARHPLEPQARQLDHLLEVTLPEFLGRGRLAGLELPDPVGDRACGCHWRCARVGPMRAGASCRWFRNSDPVIAATIITATPTKANHPAGMPE